VVVVAAAAAAVVVVEHEYCSLLWLQQEQEEALDALREQSFHHPDRLRVVVEKLTVRTIVTTVLLIHQASVGLLSENDIRYSVSLLPLRSGRP
jgi:3-methyladenine DNA glycosylase AlkC